MPTVLETAHYVASFGDGTMNEDRARRMGRDCAINGPNTTNCHFTIFTRPEWTRAWEQGKREGLAPKGEPR